MKTSSEYKRAFEIVRVEIAAWDPYALLAGGAPPDEFDAEVSKILPRIAGMTGAEELAVVVADVFRSNFNDQSFTADKCSDVASRILRSLTLAGLLTPT